MKILFLEPFYGGSHREFADGWIAGSRHAIELLTLPPRHWKWRMRGAALHFANTVKSPQRFAGAVATNLMSLADLRALWGTRCPPTLLYFHENQFSYPLAPGEEPDYQYGFTDITSALAADRILFNSHAHCRSFLTSLPKFLQMMPEFIPTWIIDSIRSKCAVAYPGCNFDGMASRAPFSIEDKTRPPIIIWNHRWEFDKNPEEFFAAIEAVEALGLPFGLVLLGERFRRVPEVFVRAIGHFKNRIIHCGFETDKRRYHRWLQKGSVVVSTARQENFGMSVVEAIRFGCLPLLPNRLAYPEIIPAEFHTEVLYSDHKDLVDKLADRLCACPRHDFLRSQLAAAMAQYAWDRSVGRFDDELEQLTAVKGQR